MNRSLIVLFCTVFFLSGCLRHNTVQQNFAQALAPVSSQKLPGLAKFLEFSENGQSLIVASDYNFVHLYDFTALENRFAMQKNDMTGPFIVKGTGYIDDNTWYFAMSAFDDDVISIRQIEPSREIYRQRLGVISNTPVFANKTHVATIATMWNWRDGSAYRVVLDSPGVFSLGMTADSLIIGQNYFGKSYLFHDPVKQDVVVWYAGSDKLTFSSDARYAVLSSGEGKCELWRFYLRSPLSSTQNERVGQCGRATFWGSAWQQIVFQRDSKVFAAATENKIVVYATEPFEQLMSATMPGRVIALALDADRLAAADESGIMRVWHTKTNKLLGVYTRDLESASNHALLAFQPGGNKLVAVHGDKTTQAESILVFNLD